LVVDTNEIGNTPHKLNRNSNPSPTFCVAGTRKVGTLTVFPYNGTSFIMQKMIKKEKEVPVTIVYCAEK